MSPLHAVGRRLLALARPRGPEDLPVHLDRRRIYVLPTSFGFFFGVLTFAMVAGALNYNNNPALLLALLLVGAGIASLVSAQLQLSGLTITGIDAYPVAAGRPLLLRVHASCKGRRPRTGLQVDDPLADSARATLELVEGAGEARLQVPTERRGWLDVPRLRISTTWPLGLARAWSYAWPDTPLLVYPAPETDAPALPEGSGEPASHRLHSSGDDVHHLRNYRAGDPTRTIAWKPSARRGSLLVREYEQPAGVDIVLDWNLLRGVPIETRISRLARWVEDAERDGRRYRLQLPGQPVIGPDRGPVHRHACMRALALLPHG